MAPLNAQLRAKRAWRLATEQHGVIALFQLQELGYSIDAVRHRIAKGRLHVIYPGVYAIGRADVSPKGRWMAAVLACSPDAFLSHESAAALWGIRKSAQATSTSQCRAEAGIDDRASSRIAARHSDRPT